MPNGTIEIKTLYDDLFNEPFESGFLREFNDLDIEIDLYMSNIMGFASKFLKNSKLSIENIEIDDMLSIQLDNCIKRLQRLQIKKNKIDRLARLINGQISKL